MLQNQLQKAIDLAKKTGDRLIVFDNAGSQDPYVVMGLDEYEKLTVGHSEVRNLTEDELLDKINRDIAIWKTDKNYDDFPVNYSKDEELKGEDILGFDEFDEEDDDFSNDFIDDMYKNDFAPPGLKKIDIKEDDHHHGGADKKPKNNWSIPKARKKSTEDIIEEDRQYLEEVPF